MVVDRRSDGESSFSAVTSPDQAGDARAAWFETKVTED
jgi:hypothetical protein